LSGCTIGSFSRRAQPHERERERERDDGHGLVRYSSNWSKSPILASFQLVGLILRDQNCNIPYSAEEKSTRIRYVAYNCRMYWSPILIHDKHCRYLNCLALPWTSFLPSVLLYSCTTFVTRGDKFLLQKLITIQINYAPPNDLNMFFVTFPKGKFFTTLTT
jgi:hypothetical protein